jgi:CubicO group peptidase (beta-lactamase class C family)
MRHLLTHTGGWPGDYFADLGRGDDALSAIVARLERLPQLTPVGEVWSYNNAGFYLAGRVVEKVADMPYEDAVETLVIKPLGLERTFFFADDVLTHRFAVGHLGGEGEPLAVARPWPVGRAHHPAGGLAASVVDLLRFAGFQMSEDGRGIVSRRSLDLMQTAQLHVGSMFESIGLAWGIADRDGTTVLSHGGTTLGQEALLVLAPQSGSRSRPWPITNTAARSPPRHAARRWPPSASKIRSRRRSRFGRTTSASISATSPALSTTSR